MHITRGFVVCGFFYGNSCSLCQLATLMLKGLHGWFTFVLGLFSHLVALQWWMDSVKHLDCVDSKTACACGDACLCDITVLNSVTWNCQIPADSGLLINYDILRQRAGACCTSLLFHTYRPPGYR